MIYNYIINSVILTYLSLTSVVVPLHVRNNNATIPPVTAAIPTDIFIGITAATDKGTKETNTNMNTVKLKETNKTKEILILHGQRLYGFIEKIDEKRKQDDL